LIPDKKEILPIFLFYRPTDLM